MAVVILCDMTSTKPLQAVLNAFPEPAILLSPDYQILLANPAYRQAYGFTDRGTAQHCYQVSHHYNVPCDQAGETCPLKQSREAREASQVLHIHHTPRGEEYVHVEMWPIIDPDSDEILYFLERMRPSDAGTTQSSEHRLVGRSASFQKMLNLVERVARSSTNILLLGESGTGKELVAQTLHRLSERRDEPFVPVECTGMPEALFESELFGYVKGAFTGADGDKVGLVESAQGGTLFLDEIGDIPLSVQVKLLRLLESRRFRRVGSTQWQETDFRLVCATNKNLREMVASGSFRDDLYYRLTVFEIDLPPLRDRQADLQPLIETMLQRLGAPEIRFSEASLRVLEGYGFPGNVRELRNIVERALLLADDGVIHPVHLPAHCQSADETQGAHVQADSPELVSLAEAEKNYLARAVATFQGDRKSLAKTLGVSERVLYRKLSELNANKDELHD